eukprot:1485037-Pleurochrysis_carterae.AAC.2
MAHVHNLEQRRLASRAVGTNLFADETLPRALPARLASVGRALALLCRRSYTSATKEKSAQGSCASRTSARVSPAPAHGLLDGAQLRRHL